MLLPALLGCAELPPDYLLLRISDDLDGLSVRAICEGSDGSDRTYGGDWTLELEPPDGVSRCGGVWNDVQPEADLRLSAPPLGDVRIPWPFAEFGFGPEQGPISYGDELRIILPEPWTPEHTTMQSGAQRSVWLSLGATIGPPCYGALVPEDDSTLVTVADGEGMEEDSCVFGTTLLGPVELDHCPVERCEAQAWTTRARTYEVAQ